MPSCGLPSAGACPPGPPQYSTIICTWLRSGWGSLTVLASPRVAMSSVSMAMDSMASSRVSSAATWRRGRRPRTRSPCLNDLGGLVHQGLYGGEAAVVDVGVVGHVSHSMSGPSAAPFHVKNDSTPPRGMSTPLGSQFSKLVETHRRGPPLHHSGFSLLHGWHIRYSMPMRRPQDWHTPSARHGIRRHG